MNAKLIDTAVMSVPGLAFLVGTVVLPGRLLTGLASAVLAVTVSAVIGYVLVWRPTIVAWPPRVVGRRIVAAAGVAVLLLIVYALAYDTVVTEYHWPPGSGEAEELLIPARVVEGELRFPYTDCTRSTSRPCLPGAEGSRQVLAAEAEDVVREIDTYGPTSYHLPRGRAWYLWVTALIGLHALTGGVLVFLFGLLRVRGVDLMGFFEDAPAEDAPAEDAPAEAVPEGGAPADARP